MTPDQALPATPVADYRTLPQWSWCGDDGVTLRGRHRPPAPGAPTVHWLSGNSFCGGIYWPYLRRLPADWGLMTHDMEGHGESDPAQRFAGQPTTVQRVRAALEQAAPAAPRIGMGHSFGAAMTLRLAARSPELFDALVLLDPIILPTPMWLGVKAASRLGRNPMAEAARRRRDAWPDRATARARLAGRGIYAGWSEEAMDAFIKHGLRDTDDGCALTCARELEAQIFENPFYLWRDVPRLRVPVLLVYGEESYFFMAPSARRVAARNAHVRVQALLGGHCFMLEAPRDCADVVAQWVTETMAA